MKINWNLLITLTLSLVIAAILLDWLLRPQPLASLPHPPGPVGFAMLPACPLA